MKVPSESAVEPPVAEDTVDINSENPETGDTPLSRAASNGAFTAVKLLLRKRSQPRLQEMQRWKNASVASG